MITVEIRLGAALREHLNLSDERPLRLELADRASLPDLYRALGLQPEQVAFCTVNNRYPPENYLLQDGDQLRIMAHAVGG
jgi:molybdopterin converting factor small subunit